MADVGEHFFEEGGHAGEVSDVLRVDASRGSLAAIGEAEQEIADTFEADHELHAGEKFAGLGGLDFGDEGSDGAVDLHVEGVEFALAQAQRIQQRERTGGDAFGSGGSGVLSQTAGFNSAANDMLVGRFGRTGDSSGTAHEISLWRERGGQSGRSRFAVAIRMANG